MAKLEGVKSLRVDSGENAKIEYNGEIYEKVTDGSPDQIGDIVAGYKPIFADELSFFGVVGINDTAEHKGTGMFYDEYGDYNGMRRYDTFRKVDAAPVGATSGAKAGDTVEMTSNDSALDYHEGEQFVVKANDEGEVYIVDNAGDERYIEDFTHLEYKIVALAEENTDEDDAPMSAPLFAKVNRPNNEPIVGDFIELDPEAADYSWLSEDKKYEIIDIDEDGDFIFNDDVGEEEWTETNDIKAIFVKYTQEQEEQKAKIGDKVLIVDEDIIHSGYGNGDIVTVKHVDSDGDIHGVDTGFIAAEEFIVLTDAQSGDSEGEKETEEEYVPQEGDIVVITGNTTASANELGDVGIVGQVDTDNTARVHVSGRGRHANWTRFSDMRLATDEEKSKYLYDAGEAPKDGDKVRLLSGGGHYPLNGYENGEVYTVESDGNWGGHLRTSGKIRITGGEIPHGFPLISQVEVVEESDEGTAETTPKVKPGDYVVNNRGTVGIVDEVSGGTLCGKWIYNEGDYDYFYPMEMAIDARKPRLATQEEIAKALGITDVAPGDKVEVIADDFFFAEPGDTSEVVELDEVGVYTKYFYIAAFTDGKPRFKVVEKAQESAPVQKADSPSTSEPYGEISVGDTVKVVVADGEVPKFDWGNAKNGEFGKVISTRLGRVVVDLPSQSFWNAEPSELIKVAENGDLLPGTVVKGNISDEVITLGKRDFDRDRSYGTAYLVKDNAPFWVGEEQFEILTKEEVKKHADVSTEEDVEAEELIQSDDIPIGTIVKVVQKGNGHYGETLRVTRNDGSGLFPYYTEKLDGGFADVYDKEHLEIVEVPAQEEEKVEEGAIEVGDLVKVIQSPAALPEGSYFIVKRIDGDGDVRDMKGFCYSPNNGRHVELIAKADEVYA